MNLNPGIALGAAAWSGGSVGGLIGAFFALPTAAAIQAFITTYAIRYEVEDTELTRGGRGGPAGGGLAATGREGPGQLTESASDISQDPDR